MRHVFFFRDWKSWISFVGQTTILLLLGIGQFETNFPFWIFALVFLFTNWLLFGIINKISNALNWNRNALQSASKHLIFAVCASMANYFISGVESKYLLAYFSVFFLVGFVFSTFDYLLGVLEELQIMSAVKGEKSKPLDSSGSETTFQLMNAKGLPKFTVPANQIICFESDDNYVTIHYLEMDVVKKRIERMSMRSAEILIENLPIDCIRVHKSFLVNRIFIESILGKAQNHKLKVKGIDFEIPVSRRLNIHEIV